MSAVMRFLIIMSSILAMGSTLSAPTLAQAPDVAVPSGDVENGRQIYVTYGCYQCHNYAAHGGRAGPRLAPRPIAFAAFARYVRTPSNQMPPYTTEIVTDQELADIYAFLLTVPPPPAVDSIPILND